MLSTLLAIATLAPAIIPVAANVQYAGVNIAGFDFGCSTDGSCNLGNTQPPLGGNGQGDGVGHMTHFAHDDGLNIFRLPVAWQYLVNNNLGGPLDYNNAGQYDRLVQACLSTGAKCIIDVHNYARWNGQIIGQPGGPTDDQFSSLWSALAGKYREQTNVAMGLMNEPHDMPDMNRWAQSVQAAVTAIRNAGANGHMILLPGTQYTSAGAFVSEGSAAALANVKNPDQSTANLIFDVHNYFDTDGSGTNPECSSNKISDGLQPLVQFLRDNNRQALVSEVGGGSTESCYTNVCAALDFLNQNADVYLGWIGWAAGSFKTDYVLSLVPNGNTDKEIMSRCIAGKFNSAGGSAKSRSFRVRG